MARLRRPRVALRLATGVCAALSVAVATPLAAEAVHRSAPGYTRVPGEWRATPRFVVTYKGFGFYLTIFHGEPPNAGGEPDTNDASDWSTQEWSLRFRDRLAVPTCRRAAAGGDPCARPMGLGGAVGPTALTGSVLHTHVDGLYRELDRAVSCDMRVRTPGRGGVDTSIALRYLPGSHRVGVTALNPVPEALAALPQQCPEQGDSIDGILDFYATPGFSFASGFGPDRWFTSLEALIPAYVLHRSAKVTIPLRGTLDATPPRDCAVLNPSFERCRTGGHWGGTLTLRRFPPDD